MIYLRNEHYEALQSTRDLLQSRLDILTDDEKKIFSAFCAFHDEALKDRERHKERSQKAMSRYRSTPAGHEKSLETNRNSYKRNKKTK